MKLSIVIPAYNEEHYIAACLESVFQETEGRKDIEIIVINNASTDATQQVAEGYKTLHSNLSVVKEQEKGLTKARQRGLEEAQGEYIAYIDADVRLPKGWLKKAEELYAKNQDLVCISGPYRYYDAPTFHNIFLTTMWYISAPITYRFVGYMVLGGNFVARKDALLKIGGFDKNIVFYGEDTDIARRLAKVGKVPFFMGFYVYSSSRRFKNQGLIKISAQYALNFAWQVFFHKPYSNSNNY
jgi:glycosyltransferase involved in cell wall biosynthesis